ncbi:hypothetical protein GWI33_021263 [Rhynchophorus ferrugineus]|uniref:Uncharacterized protein n=1 Tax=Rhynchophorus ferrugineus TaxID=354439 RepID=A0A834HNW8_RHYFE|nr:hypothetical protein GWI33_021263 [Rhynchophorus ferrugineus]
MHQHPHKNSLPGPTGPAYDTRSMGNGLFQQVVKPLSVQGTCIAQVLLKIPNSAIKIIADGMQESGMSLHSCGDAATQDAALDGLRGPSIRLPGVAGQQMSRATKN